MPLTPTQTRALLAQLGLVPRPRLGQNFLTDGNIVRKSLELAAIAPGDTVVEIGPGLGTLTHALLEAGAYVYAVEIDRHLVARLRETLLVGHPQTLHLLEGDAVEHPRAGLPAEHPASVNASFKVVANLPYAVSTPWLDALLAGPLPERLVLMLQRETAARFTAPPSTAARGAISLFVEAAYERLPGHPVSRRCFHPVPAVDSVLLSLRRRPGARAFSPVSKKWIRELFTRRRKQIGALARHLGSEADLPALFSTWLSRLPAHGLDERARPEDLPLSAWLELDELLRAAVAP
ncbi:MAG: 16S rRNA (adenine(1518)-N(6)/adenine(1519)-N(6))-dimethyltransferase RsmA [Opitutales bacterium]|jgi:16S rRNA (adenine1518-N6/adenine1519-N6)-dimethyltransferase